MKIPYFAILKYSELRLGACFHPSFGVVRDCSSPFVEFSFVLGGLIDGVVVAVVTGEAGNSGFCKTDDGAVDGGEDAARAGGGEFTEVVIGVGEVGRGIPKADEERGGGGEVERVGGTVVVDGCRLRDKRGERGGEVGGEIGGEIGGDTWW